MTGNTAAALDMTEANVKVALLRAHERMKEYDQHRVDLSPARREATRRALEQFLPCLNACDAEGLERLLAQDIVTLSDGAAKCRRRCNRFAGARSSCT
jgi:hypothetical protein